MGPGATEDSGTHLSKGHDGRTPSLAHYSCSICVRFIPKSCVSSHELGIEVQRRAHEFQWPAVMKNLAYVHVQSRCSNLKEPPLGVKSSTSSKSVLNTASARRSNMPPMSILHVFCWFN